MKQEFLKTADAAKFLCVSVSQLWKLCHRKELAYFKMGRLNVFKMEDIQAYLDANRIPSAQELRDKAEKLLNKKNKDGNEPNN